MAENSRTAIIVAIIGLTGVLCAALIANMEKIVNIVSQRNANNTNSSITGWPSPSPSTSANGAQSNTNTSNLSVNSSNAEPIKLKRSPSENADSHTEVELFPSNWNEDDVDTNRLPEYPSFTIDQPYYIKNIYNRHWGGAKPSGKGMKLRNSAGEEFGPWKIKTGDIDTWGCSPREQIPAGTYFVIDPDPATWSHNVKSNNKGMSLVQGYAVSGNTK